MVRSRGDRHGGEAGSGLDWYRAVGRVPAAELTGAVETPCPHGAVGLAGEGVAGPAGDRYHAGETRDVDRCRRPDRGVVAELAAGVRAPRLDRAASDDRDR